MYWTNSIPALLALAAVALGLSATSAAAASMAEFGRCLSRKGAVFYGASWCPHCRTQREALGEAMSSVRYIECSSDGGRESSLACRSAGVDGFPTWVFADGSRAGGVQSIPALASKTGCEAPSASTGRDAKPAESTKPTGPRIIEVPQQ